MYLTRLQRLSQYTFFIMLTKNKIIQFNQQLNEMSLLVKDMLRSRQYESLFTSEKDLRDSRLASTICPDDYYNFKCFDTLITIRYNNRSKLYYIHIEAVSFQLFRDSEFRKTFDDYFSNFKDLSYTDCGINFYIKKEISFTSCLDIFKKVCIFYLKHNIYNEILFEVY